MSFENEVINKDEAVFDDEEENDDIISIQLIKQNSETIYYTINLNDTVESLIKTYREDNGIRNANEKTYLSFKGKIMKEADTFKTYGLESDDKVNVIIRLIGGICGI